MSVRRRAMNLWEPCLECASAVWNSANNHLTVAELAAQRRLACSCHGTGRVLNKAAVRAALLLLALEEKP